MTDTAKSPKSSDAKRLVSTVLSSPPSIENLRALSVGRSVNRLITPAIARFPHTLDPAPRMTSTLCRELFGTRVQCTYPP